jgi:hypothetical protein
MEKEINAAKQTLIVAYLWPDSSYLKQIKVLMSVHEKWYNT